jgi:hypothetical protein
VRNDLEAVIEVNQGQRAFEMTNAGLEAGKMQLLFDSNNEIYNGNGGDLDGDGVDTAESEWSYSGSGKTLNLDSNQVNVKIRYLTPTPSSNPSLASDPNRAPEVLLSGATTYPNQRDYFKVTAQGTARAANRRMEAIYWTKSNGFPLAYYATGNIELDGSSLSVDDVSIFSEASVVGLRGNTIGGCDVAYGNWNNSPWNVVSRRASFGDYRRNDNSTCSGYPTGVASEGTIEYANEGAGTGRPNVIDYDNWDGAGGGTTDHPDFVDNTWTATGGSQNSTDITYPFNPNDETHLDLETLRAAAQSGQNGSRFVRLQPGGNLSILDYPANSNLNTIYFVEFANPDGTFTTSGGNAVTHGEVDYDSTVTDPKGVIVVVNGDFNGSPRAKTFTGNVIIRDPVDTDGESMQYLNRGNFDLQGYVNIEGSIEIRGQANSDTPPSLITTRRPGTYMMELWSWRECYNMACN